MMNDAAALPVTRMVMDLAIPEQLGEVLTYLIERDQPRR
jgi:hypothetical protein